MSRVYLLPRIRKFRVDAEIDRMKMEGFKPCFRHLHEDPGMFCASSGGTFDPERVESLVERIRGLARDLGCPDSGNREIFSSFDRNVTILLAEAPWLNTGEALRDDTWAYLTTMMLPDVVAWRFSGCTADRFHGGVRNMLQRLWTRGVVLDRGEDAERRWELLDRLGEDPMVQIFERSGLSNSPGLARQFAEGYLSWLDNVGKSSMENIMRDAMKILLLRNRIIDLAIQEDSVLHQEVWHAFRTAWEGHRRDELDDMKVEESRRGFLDTLMFWKN
ncbi:hypothetical protein [Halomonas salifodinae]|uniref:hypothetical protein n=1 Tax=Halomonas salifodinae TaxID=438745 RepID=UPI0033A84A7E